MIQLGDMLVPYGTHGAMHYALLVYKTLAGEEHGRPGLTYVECEGCDYDPAHPEREPVRRGVKHRMHVEWLEPCEDGWRQENSPSSAWLQRLVFRRWTPTTGQLRFGF